MLKNIDRIILQQIGSLSEKGNEVDAIDVFDIFMVYIGKEIGLQYDLQQKTKKKSSIDVEYSPVKTLVRNTHVLTNDQLAFKLNKFISDIKELISGTQNKQLINAIYEVFRNQPDLSNILPELSMYNMQLDTKETGGQHKNPRLYILKNDISVRTIKIQQVVSLNKSGNIIPNQAADYEMGVCVQYNRHIKNMSLDEAINHANISQNRIYAIRALNQFFETSINKSSLNKIKASTSLRMANGQAPVSEWKGSNTTPKTDITSDDTKYRYSIKKQGLNSKEFQLASGFKDESVSILNSGAYYYDKLFKDELGRHISVDEIIKIIQSQFKRFKIPNITKYKNEILNDYYQRRFNMINSHMSQYTKDKLTNKDITDATKLTIDNQKLLSSKTSTDITNILKYQFKRQFSEFKLWADDTKYNRSFNPFDIPKLSKQQADSILEDILYTHYTSEIITQLKGLFQTSLAFKSINKKMEQLLNTSEFKFGVVFQAATGLYKFGGSSAITATSPDGLVSDLDNASEAVANYFMILDNDGSPIKIQKIDNNIIKKLSGRIKVNTSFKTTSGYTNVSARIASTVIKQELHSKGKLKIQQAIRSYYNGIRLLNESMFDLKKYIKLGKDFINKIKEVVVDIFNKIKNKIKQQFNLIFSSGLSTTIDELELSLDNATISGPGTIDI